MQRRAFPLYGLFLLLWTASSWAEPGRIVTVAGNGVRGHTDDGRSVIDSELGGISAVSVDASGNLFIADTTYGADHFIRKITPDGIITTVAGNIQSPPSPSDDGGPATQAALNYPGNIFIDGAGNLLIADIHNYRIRLIEGVAAPSPGNVGIFTLDPDRIQSVPADTTPPLLLSSFPADSAVVDPTELDRRGIVLNFSEPVDTTFMNFDLQVEGTLLDWHVWTQNDSVLTASRPRDYQPIGFGETYQVSLSGLRDRNGNTAPGLTLRFSTPQSSLPDTASQGIITTIAGSGEDGYIGDNIPATQVSLYTPEDIALNAQGHLFIVDWAYSRIRKIDTRTGIISTVAGNGQYGFSGDGGPATQARLGRPKGLLIDSSGNLFIADSENQRIRKVDTQTGIISTVAGNGRGGFSGDGGSAIQATLHNPEAIAVDAAGHLLIADTYNHRIRKVDANGPITTVAGNGQRGFSGDGGPADQASLNYPATIAVDAAGNLLIADNNNQRIRKVDTQTGIISTVAGNGQHGFSGDGGPATQASLYTPEDVALDAQGHLFIADSGNQRIRKIDAQTGIITTVAGNGHQGFSGDSGPAIQASLSHPAAIAVDAAGNLLIADWHNQRIRMVTGIVAPTLLTPGTFSFDPTLTDTTPPTLISSFPADSAVVDPAELDRRGIVIIFDEPIDTALVDFDLQVGRETLNWHVWTQSDSALAAYRPRTQPPIGFGETYTLAISGVRDRSGNTAPEIGLQFSTKALPAEIADLHLLHSSPPDGAVDVDPDSLNNDFNQIRLTFSAPIDTTTLEVHLRTDGTELGWPSLVKNDSTLHIFRPYEYPSSLKSGRTYEVTITGLRDRSLKPARDIQIRFTTQDSATVPDTTDTTSAPPSAIPPHLVELVVSPVKRPDGDTALLHLGFDNRIDLSATRIAVRAVDRAIPWNFHSRRDSAFSISFPLQPDLPPETQYQVVLAGMRDMAGNLLPDLFLSFPLPPEIDTEIIPPDLDAVPSVAIDFDLTDGDQEKRLLHSTRQQLSLQLVAADLPPINGWSATLEFDSGQLHYVPDSFQPSGFIPQLVALASAPEGAGRVEVGGSVLGTSGSNSGDGILGQLSLEAVEGFTGRAEIAITFLRLRPLSGEPYRNPALSTATVVYVPLIADLGLDFNPAPGDQLQTAVRSAAPGDRYSLQLHIRHAPAISGWSVTLAFDPGQLRYVPDSFQPSDFIPGLLSLADDRTAGRLAIGGSVLANATYSSGHGFLGTVEFEVLEGFGERTELVASELSLHTPSRETLKSRPNLSAAIIRRLLPNITLDFDLAEGDQEDRFAFRATPDHRYRLQLNLLDSPEIDGWSATLEFDPDQLRYIPDSFQPSDFIPGLITLVDDREGQVVLGGAVLGTEGRNSGSGSLGTLDFDILDSFLGHAFLSITELSLHQTDGQVLKLQPIGAQAIFFFGDGSMPTAVQEDDPDYLPRATLLAPNYPNPFNRATVLPFQLARPASVCIDLFDVRGQRLGTLIDAFLPAGFHQFVWDGAGEQGQPVSAGIYLVRLQAGSFSQVRKIALVK